MPAVRCMEITKKLFGRPRPIGMVGRDPRMHAGCFLTIHQHVDHFWVSFNRGATNTVPRLPGLQRHRGCVRLAGDLDVLICCAYVGRHVVEVLRTSLRFCATP